MVTDLRELKWLSRRVAEMIRPSFREQTLSLHRVCRTRLEKIFAGLFRALPPMSDNARGFTDIGQQL